MTSRLVRAMTQIEVLATVAAVRLLLTAGSWRATRVLFLARRRAEPGAVDAAVWRVRRAARLVPGATCLTQALALHLVLARRGIAADVVVGVTSAGPFGAHAWVEHGDRVLIGGNRAALAAYVPLATLDPGAARGTAADAR